MSGGRDMSGDPPFNQGREGSEPEFYQEVFRSTGRSSDIYDPLGVSFFNDEHKDASFFHGRRFKIDEALLPHEWTT